MGKTSLKQKMNPIQRAWLKVLGPVQYVINEKLATRSGVIGKVGKFLIIGPREYGAHTIGPFLKTYNSFILVAMGQISHRYSMINSLTTKGYYGLRPQKFVNLLIPTLVLSLWILPFYDGNSGVHIEENDSLEGWLMKTSAQIPAGSMNQRTSAHYLECNRIYSAEMLRRLENKKADLASEREAHSDAEKRTRYAREGYTYVERPAPRFA